MHMRCTCRAHAVHMPCTRHAHRHAPVVEQCELPEVVALLILEEQPPALAPRLGRRGRARHQ
eukprot:scaffold57411_cov65-Phaeocystis_antarctica.AAC.10